MAQPVPRPREDWTLDDLRAAAKEGVDAADRGELVDGEEFFAGLLSQYYDLPPADDE